MFVASAVTAYEVIADICVVDAREAGLSGTFRVLRFSMTPSPTDPFLVTCHT